MNRREFLTWNLTGLALSGLSLPHLIEAASLPDTMVKTIPDISVVKGMPAAATRQAVQLLGGMSRFVKPGQKVVIKPNMSFARGPETATNTHPEVVREIVIMCKEAQAGKIRVLDNALQNPEQSLQLSGIRDACNSVEENICHHLMDMRFYQETDFAGITMKRNAFMRDVLEADVIIAVPVAKSHAGAGVSLSLKGQMGLIFDRYVMHRQGLEQTIVDLNQKIKPNLIIIDASRVLTSNGPGGPGKVITPQEIIASTDPVAADALAVESYEWYGRKIAPRQVKYLQLAASQGLGRLDLDNLNIKRVVL